MEFTTFWLTFGVCMLVIGLMPNATERMIKRQQRMNEDMIRMAKGANGNIHVIK